MEMNPREMHDWIASIERETLVNATKVEAHLNLLSETRRDVKTVLDRTARMEEQMETITQAYAEKRTSRPRA
ncbi:MAG: hypothetical protein M5T61_09865 [Acidimicrobiia bacterium]|nr:hypothetical protein [Acidimicrobiia bacterium]